MSTLSATGQFMSSTYYVQVRNQLLHACLANESVHREAKLIFANRLLPQLQLAIWAIESFLLCILTLKWESSVTYSQYR